MEKQTKNYLIIGTLILVGGFVLSYILKRKSGGSSVVTNGTTVPDTSGLTLPSLGGIDTSNTDLANLLALINGTTGSNAGSSTDSSNPKSPHTTGPDTAVYNPPFDSGSNTGTVNGGVLSGGAPTVSSTSSAGPTTIYGVNRFSNIVNGAGIEQQNVIA